VFKDEKIQSEWLDFNVSAYEKIKALSAKVPHDLNTRTKGIEQIIETLMQEQFEIAETLATIKYFYDVAYAEAVMERYEENPKMSTTLIKAEAEGDVAQITQLNAYGSHIWQAIERALMSAQSLLKRVP
jgi:hypothetical protein